MDNHNWTADQLLDLLSAVLDPDALLDLCLITYGLGHKVSNNSSPSTLCRELILSCQHSQEELRALAMCVKKKLNDNERFEEAKRKVVERNSIWNAPKAPFPVIPLNIHNELFHELTRINFKDQINHFDQRMRWQKQGVFILQGQDRIAQLVLLHRLKNHFCNKTNRMVLTITLGESPVIRDEYYFWHQIAQKMKCNFSDRDESEIAATKSQVIKKIVDSMRSNDLIVIIDSLLYMFNDEATKNSIKSFWETILSEIKTFNTSKCFCMFLLDYKNCIKTNNDLYFQDVRDWQSSKNCNTPLRIQLINNFSQEEINDWYLVSTLPELRLQKNPDDLWDHSKGGIPTHFYTWVCENFSSTKLDFQAWLNQN